MRSEEEIKNKLAALQSAESELNEKIEEDLRINPKSDSVMARVSFYTMQRKKIEAKIEELKWMLNET